MLSITSFTCTMYAVQRRDKSPERAQWSRALACTTSAQWCWQTTVLTS